MEFVKVDYPNEHIAAITLNRPDRFNALSYQLLREFCDVVDMLGKNVKIRVIVLTGAGKGFCAGADLRAAIGGENGPWEEGLGKIQMDYRMQQGYAGIVQKLRHIPQPIIGAINGPAAGGGFSVALACDLRIGVPKVKFNCAFTKLGLGGAEMGSSYFLPKIVGHAMAAELMYTGRFVESEEALKIGLISRIIEPQLLMETAVEMAQQMVDVASPFGLRMTKEAINLVQGGMTLEQSIHIENRNQVLGLQTKDFMTAAQGWASPTPPDYRDE